jgi:hypothetical protein
VVRTQSAGPTVYVAESAGRLLYKPSVIVTGVSGGAIYFDHWESYGGETAKADARFELRECDPDCARGKIVYVRAKVWLTAIVPCGRSPIYELLTVQTSDDPKRIEVGESVDLAALCHEGADTLSG